MHGDHVSGLPVLIDTLLWRPESGQHTDIFLAEKEAPLALEAWLNVLHTHIDTELITLKTVSVGQIYQDDNIKVTAIQTQHLKTKGNPVSFSYKIEAEDKKILYSGDLLYDFSDFPQIVRQEPFDLCICESTHYHPSKALPVFLECPLKRLIFNHIYDDWYDEGEKVLLDYYKTLPYPVEVAHDGDEFIL
jgi:ribonuclease BN (tRNA processing enzyme)